MKDGSTRELEINENNKDFFEFLLEEDFRPGEYYEINQDVSERQNIFQDEP